MGGSGAGRACPRPRPACAPGKSPPPLAGGRETSGNWPMQNITGLVRPLGVTRRSSRSPGAASAASAIWTRTVSAMAGVVGRRTKPTSLARISAIFWRSAAVGVGLFGEFLGLVAQLRGLRGGKGLEVVHYGGLHTGSGDHGGRYAVEELAADGDFEGRALASAGGVGVAGVRHLLLGGGEECEAEAFQRRGAEHHGGGILHDLLQAAGRFYSVGGGG